MRQLVLALIPRYVSVLRLGEIENLACSFYHSVATRKIVQVRRSIPEVHFACYIIIMIIMIALKGAIRDIYNLLTAPRTVSNTYTKAVRAQPHANHVLHIERLLCATSRVPRGTKGLFCFVLFVGCLTSQQHASVSHGRICTDNFTCCHTEIEAADQTFHLTQSQYTDTGPTSPSADPITPGAWQGSHWSANF